MTNETQIRQSRQGVTSSNAITAVQNTTEDPSFRDELVQVLNSDPERFEKVQAAMLALRKDPNNVELREKENTALLHFVKATGLENGENLGNSVFPFDKSNALVMRNNLISEFQVKSPSELMMIDIAVNAYFTYLRLSTLYCGLVVNDDGKTKGVNQTTINLMKCLTRHIDSAHTQMLTALTTLRQLRRPPINVKIQTKETYIAQNQQVNQTGSSA